MKASVYAIIIALLAGSVGLVAMEVPVSQPEMGAWPYDNTLFTFKCRDSANEADAIVVPGNLVYYSGTLRDMIHDLGDPDNEIIQLFGIKKEQFKRVIAALELLNSSQRLYKDLINYFESFTQDKLMELMINIDYLAIQPLLEPLAQALLAKLLESPLLLVSWKWNVPKNMRLLLKNVSQESISTPFALCQLNQQSLGSKPFTSVALNEDGSIIAGGAADNTIELFSLDAAGKIILVGHQEDVDELKFSPNSEVLGSTSAEDGTVRIWDIADRSELAQFNRYGTRSVDMQFSPDGNYFVCIGAPGQTDIRDESYLLVNRKTGHRLLFAGIQGEIYDTAISPDGSKIILVGQNTYIWDMATRTLHKYAIGQVSPMMSAFFSPDSKLVACMSAQTEFGTREIVIWDTVNMMSCVSSSKIITRAEPAQIVFSSDNRYIAFDEDREIEKDRDIVKKRDIVIWSLQEDKEVARIGGHPADMRLVSFTSNNKHLIAVSYDEKALYIVRMDDMKERKKTVATIGDIYTLDGHILIVSDQGEVSLLNLTNGKLQEVLTVPQFTGFNALSPDKKWLALGSRNGDIYLCDLEHGKSRVLNQSTCVVNDMTFSPDSRLLTVLCENGIALCLDMQTDIVQHVRGKEGAFIKAAYSIGDWTFVTEKENNCIHIYDMQKKVTYQLNDHVANVEQLLFTHDGKYLISRAMDSIIISDVHTRKLVKRIPIMADACALHPTQNVLIASDAKEIVLIDLDTYAQQLFTKHIGRDGFFVNKMIFNADGTLLAIHKKEKRDIEAIELWDFGTKNVKYLFGGPNGGVNDYFFIPNTSLLAIAGGEEMFLWDGYRNKIPKWYPLVCQKGSIQISGDGSKIMAAGYNNNKENETLALGFNQQLLSALKDLTFEQITLLARALKLQDQGKSLDLTTSPQLLAVFNQINPKQRDVIARCFNIKVSK